MGTSQLKKELHEFIDNADERLLYLVYGLFQADQQDYTLPGKPMSEDVLKSRVRAAKARIKAGQFTTQEDLEREMEEW